jgi:hypothetical protein
MLRRLLRTTATSVGRATAVGAPHRYYVTDAPAAETTSAHSVEKMWGLWNEGNLFSLTPAELSNFLASQSAAIDPKWKKAALVRQVEELLQANEQKAKQARQQEQQQSQAGGGATGGAYGSWDKDAATKGEMLLDLSQAGFYQGDTQAAPRAFQLFVQNSAPDLVVSRINTTSFPGYPSSAECYTLSAAESDQAARARFVKTLKWSAINLRTLQLDGQLHVDFGKLVLKPEVVKKGQRVLSAWTLQQRLQAFAPYHWVTCAAPDTPAAIEKLMSEGGFELTQNEKTSFDVTVRRANDSLHVVLNSKGATVSVARQWEKLQTSHFTMQGGPDVRFIFRARKHIAQEETDKYSKVPIVDVLSPEISIQLPAEHGEVLYCSENKTRVWSRPLAGGGTVSLTETKREPLVIASDFEDGERLEYALDVDIPRDATDIGDVAVELYSLAKSIAAATQETFEKSFQTAAKAPSLEQE